MADDCSEKSSIRNSVRSLKKYGSTSSHTKRNEVFVKHIISSTDTLQGIALKYGVTMEQIRRVNRLWTSDSLFLREHLMIPVSTDSPYLSPDNNCTWDKETSNPVDMQQQQQVSGCSSSTISGSLGEKTIDEFLGKIDSSISVTKNEVKRSQGNSDFLSETSIGYERRKPTVSRMRLATNNNIHQQQQEQQSNPDVLTTPHAVVMTQGKKVRTSLQRLAKQQDEMFEL